MCSHQPEQCGRKKKYMDRKKPSQRLGAYNIRMPCKECYLRSDQRRGFGDLQSDFCCKQSLHIPRKQVACKAKTEHNKKDQHTDNPVQLARFLYAPWKKTLSVCKNIITMTRLAPQWCIPLTIWPNATSFANNIPIPRHF